MRQYPPDLEASLTRWEAVKDFSIRLNRLSAEGRACRSERVALEALWVIHFDVTSLHLAIKDVVLAGWAFAVPILLRSMHDGLCASIAITNWRRPEFMAFKYSHARHKEYSLHASSRGATAPRRPSSAWGESRGIRAGIDGWIPSSQASPYHRLPVLSVGMSNAPNSG